MIGTLTVCAGYDQPDREDYTIHLEYLPGDDGKAMYLNVWADATCEHVRIGDSLLLCMPMASDLWLKDNEVSQNDINFDGCPDLQVYIGTERGEPRYHAWVWNRFNQSFYHVKDYCNIAEPEIDKERQLITSTYITMSGEIVTEVYHWIDDGFELEFVSSDSTPVRREDSRYGER